MSVMIEAIAAARANAERVVGLMRGRNVLISASGWPLLAPATPSSSVPDGGFVGAMRERREAVPGGGTVSWWERAGEPGVGIPEPVLEEQRKRPLEVLASRGLIPSCADREHSRGRAADELAGLVPLPVRGEPERVLAAFPVGVLGAEWSVAALVGPA